MSYAVTDAAESDARKELKVIQNINEELDQLASTARGCWMLLPSEALDAIDLAWWFTEAAVREVTGGCSAHADGHCPCCAHFAELKPKAERFRRNR